MVHWSMAFHSRLRAASISAGFVGGLGPFLMAVAIVIQICSIGFTSGLLAGQGTITSMLFVCKKACVVRAVWTEQPSCMN